MKWIYHDDALFNLDHVCAIFRVGDYDIALSKELDADDESYYTLCYESKDRRDEAFYQLQYMLFCNEI